MELHIVAGILHLFFIALFILRLIWNRFFFVDRNCDIACPESMNRELLERGKIQSRVLCRLTLTCCLLLFMGYAANGVWSLMHDWSRVRIHFFSMVADINITGAVAWLLASLCMHHEKVPRILRLWWILAFLFQSSLLSMDVILLIKQVKVLPYNLCMDFMPVPLCTFLFWIALRGRLNPVSCHPHDLQQPLLNKTPQPKWVSNNGHISMEQNPQREICYINQLTPYSRANVWSLMTFHWLNPLFAMGYKKTLEVDDVPNVAGKDTAQESYRVLETNWCCQKVETNIQNPSMLKVILSSVWKGMIINALFAAIFSCATYIGPYLINLFVEYLGGTEHFSYEGYVLASVFFGAKMIESLAQRQWYFGAQQLGMRVRSGLTALVYRKGLRLSNRSRQKHTVGEIINYMSVDVERIGTFAWYMHDIWLLPLQVLLALVILYKNLGMASIAGLLATVGVMVGNTPFAKLQEKYQGKIMEAKDRRMKATSEILKSMRLLKLQAWETIYLRRLQELRRVEQGYLRTYLYTSSAVTFLFWAAPTFVSAITFGTCLLMGVPLTTGKVLSALATFQILQEPIYNLPELVSMIAQCKVSLNRIATFVQEEELQCNAVENLPRDSVDVAIEIKDGDFSWDPTSNRLTLRGINLQIRKGMKIAVCGSVGSGKSSLLSSILGEIPKLSGTVKVSGTIAYVPQSPWIQSGKIEDNILFGNKMNKTRYEGVLEACVLKKDLELFSHGDQTEIGERGINLSGGQKQRLQLARAIYQDADIYLLDDPFSAVDAHTGAQLFKECLLGVLGSKTVVYVTHQVEFLSASDLILVMQDGDIFQVGKNEDILGGTGFLTLVGAHQQALNAIDAAQISARRIVPQTGFSGSRFCNGLDSESKKLYQNEVTEDKAPRINENRFEQIVKEEERETGKVKMQVYSSFITAAYKGALVPIILAAHILFQVLQIGSNCWMAWATPPTQDQKSTVSNKVLILVYIVLAVGSSMCVLVRSLLLSIAALETAQRLFTAMLTCIFHAPMSFFDSTPTGRILNRASTDQSTVDTDIPYRLGGLAFAVIQLLGIATIISLVAWQVFIVLIPVTAISLWYQHYYISSARELARLVGIRKAPIIHHFAESLTGAAIIRSFNQETRFMNTNLCLNDYYSKLSFHNNGAMEWLCLRLNFLSNLVFLAALTFLVSLPNGTIDPSLAGLAVTYGLNLNVVQAWVIWNLCNVENKMISVERIMQYSNIPSEAPLLIDSSRPNHNWPSRGTIVLQNLEVRYGPHLPFVLKGITCEFPGGEKIGIVGRTGSGKSTLLQVLFRIVEPTGGRIAIDGVDISKIGLHDLRSKLSIIPQDPILFEGTIRSNMDPLEEHSDTEIWEALNKCQIGQALCSRREKLDTLVTENGENWSVGQRQLLCLGRALLKHSRILVMDEATASVDTATDTIIQHIIQSESHGCTVITIAHRIPTVIDSDKVLVLNEGKIVEYDSPAKLLEDESSSFAKLVSEFSARSKNFPTYCSCQSESISRIPTIQHGRG